MARIPKREPGEPTEVHHLRLYLAVGVRLKQRAVEARRRFADYLRLVLERHAEELYEADRKARLISPGVEDAIAKKHKPPKKVPWQWRKGEERRVYHFRLPPAVRIVLKQRGDQVGRTLPDYMRLVLQNHVEELDRAESSAYPIELGIDGGVATKGAHPEQVESFRPEAERGVKATETGVYHFRLPLSVAAALKGRAVASRRRFADYVRIILEDHACGTGALLLHALDEVSRKGEPASQGDEDQPLVGEKATVPLGGTAPLATVEGSEPLGGQKAAKELATLRRSVETAVRLADETAWHGLTAFAEWFTCFAAMHDEGNVREAIQGLNLPRCAVRPRGEWENWEDLLHRGRKLAESLASREGGK